MNLAAQRIRIGPSLTPAAFNVEIEAADPALYKNQLRAICRLARMSTVFLVTIAAASSGSGLDDEGASCGPGLAGEVVILDAGIRLRVMSTIAHHHLVARTYSQV